MNVKILQYNNMLQWLFNMQGSPMAVKSVVERRRSTGLSESPTMFAQMSTCPTPSLTVTVDCDGYTRNTAQHNRHND